MLSTSKLIQESNKCFKERSIKGVNNKQVYKNGFYDGYLFSEKSKVLPEGELMVIVGDTKKKKTKTTTGKLANVGIGKANE